MLPSIDLARSGIEEPDQLNVDTLMSRLEAELRQQLTQRKIVRPLMIGIQTGGAWVAERLAERLDVDEPLGLLNISFYRDDFSQIGMQPQVVGPSKIPVRIDGRDIVLVDDVLYTGRTIRAALNEIFDYGRPSQVVLGVVIERDGRQVPIQADAIGARVKLGSDQRIKLVGPESLRLVIQEG